MQITNYQLYHVRSIAYDKSLFVMLSERSISEILRFTQNDNYSTGHDITITHYQCPIPPLRFAQLPICNKIANFH
ncbi:MAG TPA: hypothetical protein DGO89_11940 [Microcoleaceae bacterium UBA9251]|nr:hypothetical protein [Microcoleaceae cyanobacterium UBA9251]